MKDKKSRICCVCHNEYTYCPRCNEDKSKPTWYFSFCSENCKEIYQTTSQFENGIISKEDALSKLSELDISGLKNFGNSYKDSIYKIQKEELSESKTKKRNKRSSIKEESAIEDIKAESESE